MSDPFAYRTSDELMEHDGHARRKGRVDKIAIAFQPDSVEVELRKLPFTARFALYSILFLIVAAIVWAAWAKVDRSVAARGKLVSQSRTVVQQPIKASIIRSIDVKPGDVVAEGQPIATLDPTLTKVDETQLLSQIEDLEAELARIEAEIVGEQFSPVEISQPYLLQKNVFSRRATERENALAGFDSKQETLTASLEIAIAQEGQVAALLSLAEMKLEKLQQLANRAIGSQIKVEEGQAEVQRLTAALAEKAAEQLKLQRQQEGVEVERQQFFASSLRSLEDRKLAIITQLQQLDFELQKAEKVGEFDVFTAMSEGVILDTTTKSVGSTVTAGEVLFTIVPIDKGLDVEVELSARDIGWVHIGQPVRVKLDPFPFQRHGTIDGELTLISPDAFQRQVNGQTQVYYRGKVTVVDNKLRNLPDGFKLLPGITITAEIRIGKRTVLSYITDPFHRALDESLKEPN